MTDFETTFAARPLDGSSRFSLLGLLAGLYGLVDKPRAWELNHSPRVETCEVCARSIVPHDARFSDRISGHLVRHVECHFEQEAAERQRFGTVRARSGMTRSPEVVSEPADERELANVLFGERVVNAMFGETGPVRLTTTGKTND